ncbi:hypothetical protein [Janibacter sp. G368]|uniref:hypothetical protein n=1 Tax=Janibacter sp. G368 TaxID=3420441 RepID=UPI003D008121
MTRAASLTANPTTPPSGWWRTVARNACGTDTCGQPRKRTRTPTAAATFSIVDHRVHPDPDSSFCTDDGATPAVDANPRTD